MARVQAPQDRDGDNHDVEIYNDAGDRAREEPPVDVEAMPRGFRKPAFAHRGAMKNGRRDGEQKPCGDEGCGYDGVGAEEAGATPVEKTDVEEDCGVFGQCNFEVVEETDCITILVAQGEIFGGYGVDMAAETDGYPCEIDGEHSKHCWL